jgi:hypothetical protein
MNWGTGDSGPHGAHAVPFDSNLLNPDAAELLLESKRLVRALTQLHSCATAAAFDFCMLKGRKAT